MVRAIKSREVIPIAVVALVWAFIRWQFIDVNWFLFRSFGWPGVFWFLVTAVPSVAAIVAERTGRDGRFFAIVGLACAVLLPFWDLFTTRVWTWVSFPVAFLFGLLLVAALGCIAVGQVTDKKGLRLVGIILGFVLAVLALTTMGDHYLGDTRSNMASPAQAVAPSVTPSESSSPSEEPDDCPEGEARYLGPSDVTECYSTEDVEESPTPQPSGGVDCPGGYNVSYDRSEAAKQARLVFTDDFEGEVPDVEAFRRIVAKLAMHEPGLLYEAYNDSPLQNGETVLRYGFIADGHRCYGPEGIRAYERWLPTWRQADISSSGEITYDLRVSPDGDVTRDSTWEERVKEEAK